MKRRDFLEQWNPSSLKLNIGFLNAEFIPIDGEHLEGSFHIAKGNKPKPDETSLAPAHELLEILAT